MTTSWIIAFVVMPASLVAIAYAAMVLHMRSLRKADEAAKKPR